MSGSAAAAFFLAIASRFAAISRLRASSRAVLGAVERLAPVGAVAGRRGALRGAGEAGTAEAAAGGAFGGSGRRQPLSRRVRISRNMRRMSVT